MEHKIINTENYLLIVDDTEIKEGDWIYCDKYSLDSYKYDFIKHIPLPIVTRCFKKNGYDIWFNYDDKKYEAEAGFNSTVFKIIAHLPLNNSPILEGVDLLPQIEDEVEKLAKNFAKESGERYSYEDFKAGYNKTKEKYKYTEEDMIKCWKYASIDKNQIFGDQIDNSYISFIQSLQQPQILIGFKYEVKYIAFKEEKGNLEVPKTFINSQGLTQWVGEYIYE